MKITIFTIGTRGDVQPLIALGVGLQRAGHDVKMLTHDNFKEFVESYHLKFEPVTASVREVVRELVAADSGGSWLNTSYQRIRLVTKIGALSKSMISFPLIGQQIWDSLKGSEAIICNLLALWGGYHVADKLKVPIFTAVCYPISATGNFPSLVNPLHGKHGKGWNRFTHQLADLFYNNTFRSKINRWRQEVLDLPSLPLDFSYRVLHGRLIPIMYGFSESVLPKPDDWGDHVKICGYWFLDRQTVWRPEPALQRFLDAGPAPIYVGFGSMVVPKAERITEVVLQALHKTGHRGLLLTGWGAMSAEQKVEKVFFGSELPHDALFPHTLAVVHHGGPATLGEGLRAGKPAFIIPFIADQFIWGERVADLEVGPKPLVFRSLTVDKMSAALDALATNARYRENARAISEQINGEDSIARAVEFFESYIKQY